MRNAARAAGPWRRNRLSRSRTDVPWFGRRTNMSQQKIADVVKQKYAAAAKQAAAGGVACCGGAADLSACDPISKDLYDGSQIAGLPQEAVAASLGCGNPTALAELRPGETVLDLGSGGGIDVLLSAQRGGPAGKAYR